MTSPEPRKVGTLVSLFNVISIGLCISFVLYLQGIIIVETAHIYLSVIVTLSHNFAGVHLNENERKAGKENERKPGKIRIKEDSNIYKQVWYHYSRNSITYEQDLRTL